MQEQSELIKHNCIFENFCNEYGIVHLLTKVKHPQTNGKIERFWRTIEEDFVEETVFESRGELDEELLKYLIYYNEYRPHQGLNGQKPAEVCRKYLEDEEK